MNVFSSKSVLFHLLDIGRSCIGEVDDIVLINVFLSDKALTTQNKANPLQKLSGAKVSEADKMSTEMSFDQGGVFFLLNNTQ